MCWSSWWSSAPEAPLLPDIVVVAWRAGEDGGDKVERPEPKARTYDLDVIVGRRTLVSDDDVAARLWTGRRPVFASSPSRVAEVWPVRRPRHLFVPLVGP